MRDTRTKALRAIGWALDIDPNHGCVSGDSRIFWDELVQYHLLSNDYIKLHTSEGRTWVKVTEKGRLAVSESLEQISNA